MSIKKALDENTIVREARTRLEWNLGDMVCLTPYQAEVVREDIETLVLAIVGTAMRQLEAVETRLLQEALEAGDD